MPDPKFPLGRTVITTDLQGQLQEADPEHWEKELKGLIDRRTAGDWGDLDKLDRQANDRALQDGGRLFSSYQTSTGIKVYVITEPDRSCTTGLLPTDY